MSKSIYDLGLNERMYLKDLIILRVPGGWIYTIISQIGEIMSTSFVNFNDEFQAENLPPLVKKEVREKSFNKEINLTKKNFLDKIIKYIEDEDFPLEHLYALKTIVFSFNYDKRCEAKIFSLSDELKNDLEAGVEKI